MMDSSTPKETRILASKELHSLSKTYTLLIKDIPFITNISKYYDQDILNSNYDNPLHSKGTYSNKNDRDTDRNPIQRKDMDKHEELDNPFDFNGVDDGKTVRDDGGLNADKGPNKYKNLNVEVFADMQRQMHISDTLKGKSIEELTMEEFDRMITPQHKESIKKIEKLLDD